MICGLGFRATHFRLGNVWRLLRVLDVHPVFLFGRLGVIPATAADSANKKQTAESIENRFHNSDYWIRKCLNSRAWIVFALMRKFNNQDVEETV